MTDTDWLAKLAPGDPVIISLREFDRLDTVTRLTATQIVVGTMKFRKDDGRKINSDTWNTAYLDQYTLEKAEVIKLTTMRRTLWTILNNVKKIDVECLDALQCHELFAHLKLLGLTNHKE